MSTFDPPAQPTDPSTAFLERMDEAVQNRLAEATPDFDLELSGPEHLKSWKDAEARVEEVRADLDHIVRDLHAHPEEAFEEHHAQAVIAEVLQRRGFQVERGAHGVSTALRAEWHSADYDPAAHPTVAVLSLIHI